MSASRCYVALGSNLGNRRAALEGALEALRAAPGVRVLAASSFHRTEPVGGPEGQGEYLNAAVALRTELEPRELLCLLLSIEAAFGRDRSSEPRWGPRTLDLDLLMHGDRRVESIDLVLPHPRMEERLFVLRPLAEVAPGLRLPRSGEPIEQRIERLLAQRERRLQGEPA